MKNFIIFFLANTGSSAIISHLNKLKNYIEILGFEPFDQYHMKKNMGGEDLKTIFDIILNKDINYPHNKINELYEQYTDKKFPVFDKNKSVGFKMRFRDWETIGPVIKNNDTVVFVLIREDVFRWALSLYDKKANQFAYLKGNIDKNHKIHVDVNRFKEIIHRCELNLEERHKLIEKLEKDKIQVFPIYYEEYCCDKNEFFRGMFEKIDINISDQEFEDFIKVQNYFKKVHDDDIKKFVSNYDELKKEFGNRYDC